MNKKNKKESDNEINSIEEETKIIEEIIKNKLINDIHLNKDYEESEDDEEDEDDLLEKDKITEEILDNKLSFIIPEEEEKSQNEINTNKRNVHKDIIEDLLIELFNYHYNSITKQKRKSPQARMFATKYHLEFFYTKLNINFINFSKYVLMILQQKMEELIEYIKNKFYKNKITIKDVLNIKKSLFLVGINIKKTFERTFEKTRNFDMSSILEVLFISEILNDNVIEINDEEYEEIINISKLDEKDNFEKYIEECKAYFENIENGEREEKDVEVEEEKINDYDYEEDKNEEIKNNEITNEIKEENKDINNNNDNDNDDLNKNKICKIKNEEKINNKIIKENEEKKNSDNENEEKPVSLEELVKYINSSDNKKKKKKKRKKKKKVEEHKDNNTDNNTDKEIEEKDDVIINFKSYIINYSDNLEIIEKIKPKISKSFLDKL